MTESVVLWDRKPLCCLCGHSSLTPWLCVWSWRCWEEYWLWCSTTRWVTWKWTAHWYEWNPRLITWVILCYRVSVSFAFFKHCLYCLHIQNKNEWNTVTLKNHDPVKYCCSESSTHCSLRKNQYYIWAANCQTITTQQRFLRQMFTINLASAFSLSLQITPRTTLSHHGNKTKRKWPSLSTVG